MAEYSVHPLIRQGFLEIHIALPNLRLECSGSPYCYCQPILILSLTLNKIQCTNVDLLIKQETEQLE